MQTDSTTANTNGVATGERKTLPEMGTISQKLGVDELPPSSEAADLIEDHENRGRTGNYILISVISCGAPALWPCSMICKKCPTNISKIFEETKNLLKGIFTLKKSLRI